MNPIEYLRSILRPQPVTRLLDQYEWERQVWKQGFIHWMQHPPPKGIWIEAVRSNWDGATLMKTGEQPDEMNVCGLFWRQPEWVKWDPEPSKTRDIRPIIRQVCEDYNLHPPEGFATYLADKIREALR